VRSGPSRPVPAGAPYRASQRAPGANPSGEDIMRDGRSAVVAAALLLLVAIPVHAAEVGGRIEGRVLREDGSGVGGVTVTLPGRAEAALTSADGRFELLGVEPGRHTLTFMLGRHPEQMRAVEVTAGETAAVELVIAWPISLFDTLTVNSVSRRPERIVEAPAAMSLVPEEEIAREAASGQLPKLLEFTTGAELTQGGLYDFNLNVRGFNDPFNRRVLTLVDGRDVSMPSLGAQEWAAIGFPLDDLERAELVRGPGSALYGTDAFNGVLDLITKAPRYSQGGRLRMTGGELATRRVDLRYAARLGEGWYTKMLAGYQESDDFYRSRTQGVEYSTPCLALFQPNCLPAELVAPPRNGDEVGYASVRVDPDLGDGVNLTLEAGTAMIEGPVMVAEFGRLQVTDVKRPWARFDLGTPSWNLLASYTARDGDGLFLGPDYPFHTESDRVAVELQGRTEFAGGKGFLVGGASTMEESVDSLGPDGVQTVTYQKHEPGFQALFGQVEYDLTHSLKVALAARLDDNTLHDTQFSPRGSLVWAVRPAHTLRLTFGEAFLTPGYAQLVLYMPLQPPVDLSPFEQICAIGGASCGFDEPVGVRAVGNSLLEPEEIRTFEIGYSGIVGGGTYITIDYYDSQIENFISDYIAFFDPSRGRLPSPFAPYQPPASLPPPLAGLLMGALQTGLPPELFPLLSNGVFGEPVFTALSLINFGRVDSKGGELSLSSRLGDRWSLDLGYAWFDFDIRDRLPDDPALPNSSENRLNASLTYVGDLFDAAMRVRHVEGFDWSAGLYKGPVPSYQVVDLTANRQFGAFRVGIDVSNLLDEEHYEFFGGDLIGRRALVHLSYDW
jgi:iron complex outermembrane receptor protein